MVNPLAVPSPELSLDTLTTLPAPLPDAEQRLAELALAIQDDLEVLCYPRPTWNYSKAPDVLEVAIVGGGHTGRCIAFGLRRYGIEGVRIFDRNSPGQEGPWRTYARNHMLRTPKIITGGLEWGIPNLNVCRWCKARYGEEYWQRITHLPRLLWAEYLDWYAQILQLPLQNQTEIQDITWNPGDRHFQLHTAQGEYKARFVVLTTGMESAGGKFVPPIVRRLPAHCYAHTLDTIDFAALQGQRVVIIGGGAGAFDNANAALRAGAAQVDLMIRRPALINVNCIRWSEWNGFHRHYIDLEDDLKWYYSREERRRGQLPPASTYYEAIRHPRFALHTNAPIAELQYRNGQIVGRYGSHELQHDFLICGTGFISDLTRQPELRSLLPQLLLWGDRYPSEADPEQEPFLRYPYLGKHLEFLPKQPDHDYVRRCYYLASGPAGLSGFRSNLSGLQYAAPKVVYDISRQLFLEHQAEIRDAFDRYDLPEF